MRSGGPPFFLFLFGGGFNYFSGSSVHALIFLFFFVANFCLDFFCLSIFIFVYGPPGPTCLRPQQHKNEQTPEAGIFSFLQSTSLLSGGGVRWFGSTIFYYKGGATGKRVNVNEIIHVAGLDETYRLHVDEYRLANRYYNDDTDHDTNYDTDDDAVDDDKDDPTYDSDNDTDNGGTGIQ